MSFESLLSPETARLRMEAGLILESSQRLAPVEIAYRTWGRLNASGGNAILVCHALTGNADADAWWSPLFGAGRALDPGRDFIICSNVLGSCYGTTGPSSPSPHRPARKAPRPYGPDFPALTLRDMVRAQALLLDALGVHRLRLVLGGSMGGMQVLEWASLYPWRVETIAPIAVSARHSAWCIALSEAQRQAIRADPRWRQGRYAPETPPTGGLAVARMIAMASYRSRTSFEDRFGRNLQPGTDSYQVESYLRYQGDRFGERFDANSYLTLTAAMDSHDLGRGLRSPDAVLGEIPHPALVVGIDSDVLYPLEEQRELAEHLPSGRLAALSSPHGHDAFLIEGDTLNDLLVDFRRRSERRAA